MALPEEVEDDTTVSTGNSTITIYGIKTVYRPLVVAWEAAKDNLAEAMPLYSCGDAQGIGHADPHRAIRSDGKVFQLNN